eukprot:IDg11335t1
MEVTSSRSGGVRVMIPDWLSSRIASRAIRTLLPANSVALQTRLVSCNGDLYSAISAEGEQSSSSLHWLWLYCVSAGEETQSPARATRIMSCGSMVVS